MHKGRRAAIWLGALVSIAVASRAAALCTGDCDGDGLIEGADLRLEVEIALGEADPSTCAVAPAVPVEVDALVASVLASLGECGSPRTATPQPSETPTPTQTSPPTPTVTPTATATSEPTLPEGGIRIRDLIERDANGVLERLGDMVTSEGVVTVSAGLFANNKLKIFAQDGDRGLMVYAQSSAGIEAFQMGDRLRVTGVVRQQDPTSDTNPHTGTPLVDVTQGAVVILSHGNPLPEPRSATLAEIGQALDLVGTLVRVGGVHKESGDWPVVDSRFTEVIVNDGTASLSLRFQRPVITPQLVQKLDAIGDGPFTLTGIIVQDDADGNAQYFDGIEIWTRGADDIEQ